MAERRTQQQTSHHLWFVQAPILADTYTTATRGIDETACSGRVSQSLLVGANKGRSCRVGVCTALWPREEGQVEAQGARADHSCDPRTCAYVSGSDGRLDPWASSFPAKACVSICVVSLATVRQLCRPHAGLEGTGPYASSRCRRFVVIISRACQTSAPAQSAHRGGV